MIKKEPQQIVNGLVDIHTSDIVAALAVTFSDRSSIPGVAQSRSQAALGFGDTPDTSTPDWQSAQCSFLPVNTHIRFGIFKTGNQNFQTALWTRDGELRCVYRQVFWTYVEQILQARTCLSDFKGSHDGTCGYIEAAPCTCQPEGIGKADLVIALLDELPESARWQGFDVNGILDILSTCQKDVYTMLENRTSKCYNQFCLTKYVTVAQWQSSSLVMRRPLIVDKVDHSKPKPKRPYDEKQGAAKTRSLTYATVAQWQSSSLVMSRSLVVDKVDYSRKQTKAVL